MPVGAAAAYFHQQRQAYPNGYLHPNHHPHLHMNQPHFYHPNLFQHYHPMMSARGILIEIMDDVDPANYTSDGVNGSTNAAPETLYMVTMNGQQFVMNEEQVRQLVTEVYQQQTYQENLQQQQHFHQQQQFYQQQQHFQRQQQQQNFQQPYPFQEQQQQQQQQQQRFPQQ